jgi:hypothetical protein
MDKIVHKHRAENPTPNNDRGRVGQCPAISDFVRMRYLEISQNPSLSFQPLFLSYRAPNRMKFGHNGHLNTRNKFSKEVFLKSKDIPSDFG